MLTVLGLPFSEILALISIMSLLVGAIWTVVHLILASRYVSKKAYYTQRREDTAEHERYWREAQAERAQIRKDLGDLKESHRDALNGPLGQMVSTIKKIEDSIERTTARSQDIDEKLIAALNQLGTRVSVLEDRAQRL